MKTKTLFAKPGRLVQRLGESVAVHRPERPSNGRKVTRSRDVPAAIVTSGVVEVAAGALAGWVYTFALTDKNRASRVGIVSTPRIRQWHLDLIALGTGTAAIGLAVPAAPKMVQCALAVGGWSNAMLFLPLAFKPSLEENGTFRAVVAASFVTTSLGFCGMAATAVSRRR